MTGREQMTGLTAEGWVRDRLGTQNQQDSEPGHRSGRRGSPEDPHIPSQPTEFAKYGRPQRCPANVCGLLGLHSSTLGLGGGRTQGEENAVPPRADSKLGCSLLPLCCGHLHPPDVSQAPGWGPGAQLRQHWTGMKD